jgi:hypothetical protein
MSRTEPGGAVTPSQRILAPNAASGKGASGGIDTLPTQRHQTRPDLPLLVGLATVAFTAVYLISDVIEVAQGGFSAFRLVLTYAGEAAIPLFVIGLYAVQRPRIGRLGFTGAIGYATPTCSSPAPWSTRSSPEPRTTRHLSRYSASG